MSQLMDEEWVKGYAREAVAAIADGPVEAYEGTWEMEETERLIRRVMADERERLATRLRYEAWCLENQRTAYHVAGTVVDVDSIAAGRIRKIAAVISPLQPEERPPWTRERADTVAMLRRVCEEFGDNDWPDELHLADVIEKHLERWLPPQTKPPQDGSL